MRKKVKKVSGMNTINNDKIQLISTPQTEDSVWFKIWNNYMNAINGEAKWISCKNNTYYEGAENDSSKL